MSSLSSSDAVFWAPKIPPKVRYEIECRIARNPQQLRVEGAEVARFRNDSGNPLRRLAVTSPGGSASLDARLDGRPVPLQPGITDDGQSVFLVNLKEPLEPGRDAAFEVEFRLDVPAEEKAALVGWHPRLCWGREAHDDFVVKVDAPAGYALGTSGRFGPETGAHHGSDLRAFGLFLGRDMEALEGEAGDVHVRAICTSAGEQCARLLLDTAVDVVTFYRDHFGFYPHSTLTIVPGMDRPAGGYPLASALVVVHGQERMAERPEEHWRWITAHEIGHEYWGEHVLVRPPAWWLLIGLGIHTDRQFWRARGYSLERYAQRLEGYVATAEAGLETRLELSPEEQSKLQFDYNSRIGHDKSYSVMNALECIIGDEALREITRRCLAEFAGLPMGRQDFQSVCERETGRDLTWFFHQWGETDGVLCYRCADSSCEEREGRCISTVTVEREGQVRMPVPVEAAFEDGTTQRGWTDRLLDTNVLEFESAAPLAAVKLDPDHRLPMASRVPEAADKLLLRQISELPWRGSAQDAPALFRRALERSMQEANLWGKLGMALFDGGYCEEALRAFGKCADLAKADSHWSFSAPAWRGHLLDLLGRREEALAAYRLAVERVGERYVRHDQYGLRVDRAWLEERLQQPFRDAR
jgi:tetratricopeptide (TPR) repeat protein